MYLVLPADPPAPAPAHPLTRPPAPPPTCTWGTAATCSSPPAPAPPRPPHSRAARCAPCSSAPRARPRGSAGTARSGSAGTASACPPAALPPAAAAGSRGRAGRRGGAARGWQTLLPAAAGRRCGGAGGGAAFSREAGGTTWAYSPPFWDGGATGGPGKTPALTLPQCGIGTAGRLPGERTVGSRASGRLAHPPGPRASEEAHSSLRPRESSLLPPPKTLLSHQTIEVPNSRPPCPGSQTPLGSAPAGTLHESVAAAGSAAGRGPSAPTPPHTTTHGRRHQRQDRQDAEPG